MEALKKLWKSFWKIIVTVGIVVALVVGIWSIDTRYVIREIFDIAQASDAKARQNIQVQFMESRALDRLFYWQKLLIDLKVRRESNPDDKCIQEGIADAQKEIDRTKEELKSLKKMR